MFPDGILSPPENVMNDAVKAVSALGEKECKELVLNNSREIRNHLKEGGSEIDWSKVKSLTGTDEEKCEAVQKKQAYASAAMKRLNELKNKSILSDRNEQRIEAIEAAQNGGDISESTANAIVKALRNQVAGVSEGNANVGRAFANAIHEDYTAPMGFDGGTAIKHHWLRKGPIQLKNVGLNDVVRTAHNAMSTALGADGGFQVIPPASDTVVDNVRRQLEFVNLFPRVEVPYPQYIYMKEDLGLVDATGNNLPFTVENKDGIAGTQVQYRWVKEVVEVRELMIYSKVTGQQLSYIPTLQGRINNNMVYDALRRLDGQIINGAAATSPGEIGTPEAPAAGTNTSQLKGLNAFLGANETIAMPATAVQANALTDGGFAANDSFNGLDIIPFMIKDVMELGGAGMDFLAMNPTVWARISIMRDANGIRLIGDEQTRSTPALTGIPVTQSPVIEEETVFGGSRNWAELPFMNGTDLAMTDTHGEDFLANLITIRLMLRAALAVLRPSAFKKVTGFKTVVTLT